VSGRIPMCDLGPEGAEVEGAVRDALERVLASRQFVLGPEVEAFEAQVAGLLGVRHAVGVSSGSDALLAALLALGIGPGDEVITTPFSFFATVECILRVGATPRFADVNPGTLNLDPEAAAQAVGPRTRAILVVHLYGRPAALEPFAALCERRGLALVEDAAQAFGVRHAGRAVGSWGRLGCFSFFPAKPLGAFGDAGLVVTGDDALAERVRALRVHGAVRRNEHRWVGGNFRLDALQAAVLGAKLPGFDRRLAERQASARRYDAGLQGVAGLEVVSPGTDAERGAAVYTVRAPGRRDALRAHLGRAGIDSAVYYPIPLHRQAALGPAMEEAGAFPVAERAAAEVLSLPLYSGMAPGDVDGIIEQVRGFFGR
jgi:dTDP-4-amino-4,6-dideoxygalactose transaminase